MGFWGRVGDLPPAQAPPFLILNDSTKVQRVRDYDMLNFA